MISYRQSFDSYYDQGWNDAVNEMMSTCDAKIDYKTVSMCVNSMYCQGWNDAVKENKRYEV